MKHLLPLLLLLFLFGALASPTLAQNAAETADLPSPPVPFDQPVRFDNLTLEDGLAQGSVYAIHQDRKGFMWFGTQDGISRYDGYSFKNYAHIPFDSTSAQPSFVFDIDEDADGYLWLAGTFGGVSRLDPSTGTFVHYEHDPENSTSLGPRSIWTTLIDRDGMLWVGGNGGLDRMDPEHPGRFEHYRHDPEDEMSLSHDEVRALYQDASGYIWASTGNGLSRMDPETPGNFERFVVNPNESGGPENRPYVINRVHMTSDDVLWAGTKVGLIRLDVETGTFTRLIPPGGEGGDKEVISVAADPGDDEILWLTMPAGGGIIRFDVPSETFTPFRRDPGNPASPVSSETTSAYTDRSGTVWVGTTTYGISKFNPSAVGFSVVSGNSKSGGLPEPAVWGIHIDSKGNLWAGGVGGTLQFVERKTGQVRTWAVDWPNRTNPQSPAGITRNIVETSDGAIWLATNRGLDRVDLDRGLFTHFRHDPQDTTGLTTDNIRSVYADARGSLWLGTSDVANSVPLTRFDPASGTFTKFKNDPKSETSMRADMVWTAIEDHEGILWFGTDRGVSSMDPNNPGVFRHFHHNPRDPLSITNGNVTTLRERQRKPGILWMGTSGGGLDRLDTTTGAVKHYTTQSSNLPNNTIYAILEDDGGHLWISTNRGLSRFDPDAETFTNYGIEHGLQSLEFNQHAAARSQDGELFFGGVKGINAFYPEEVTINALPPPVALTDLRLFNERIVVGPDSPLKESLERTREIELTHDQARNVGFDFVALHYKNPELNRYAYQLEGFDADWIDAGAQRSATYTNLPPGSYTFRVKAANSDGVWNEEGAALMVSVLPPWWRTIWAYVIYGLLVVGAVGGIDRVQRRRLRRKAELAQAELRARAAESEKDAAEAEAKALQADNEKKKNAELLSEIGKELTSSLDLATIFDRVYDHVNHLVDASVFGVGLYNEEKHEIEYRLAIENGKRYAPYSRDTNDKNQFPVWCIEHRETVFVNDVENEYKHYINSYQHLGGRLEDGAVAADPQSLIYLPLLSKDRVLGVISIQSFEKNAYSEHDLNILRALATYTAIAVDNADAYRRLNGTLAHLQNAQQQLVQQEKLASLGQLTAGIAHEIKNPLNFVTNFSVLNEELAAELQEILSARRSQIPADLIGEIEDLVTSLRVNAGHVAKHGKRADGIVKSMMEHASGGQGERFPVDVNAVVDEYVNLAYHGRRAQSPGIELYVEREFEDGVGSAEMAPQELGRVLVNLLNNAFDAVAAKDGGKHEAFRPTITVRTHRHDGEVRIAIEDNGSGIPEAVRARIFEPFFTTKPTGSGTGLGLSLSYDIVAHGHGGRLDVESEEGRGTVFTIQLPVQGKTPAEVDAV